MKALLVPFLCLVMSAPSLAQSSDHSSENEPATRDDIILYLRTVHSHDMIKKTMEAMLKPMDQMYRDQGVRDSKKPPSTAGNRYEKTMDDLMTHMPFDEMTQAMIPVYQKHFTRGDIKSLITFYSSPTGQKVLEEMPAITAESMQAMMPIMRAYLDKSRDQVQQEVKDEGKDSEKNSPPANQDTPVQQ
jgi:hypothetical protein